MGIGFMLENWCAFLPGQVEGSTSGLLSADEALDVSFLPPMKRRRLSNLSRLSLRLAEVVAPDFQGYCVFGSQHGELITTQKLLESIVQGEIVSPAGFSASVHNTAVGLHSINVKNTYPCTSLSAGIDTLAMCFVEACALLETGEAQQVLLVCADDVVPEGLAGYVNKNEMRGFAAMVKLADNTVGRAVILSQTSAGNKPKKKDPIRSLVSFLGNTGQESVVVSGETGQWRWQHNVS